MLCASRIIFERGRMLEEQIRYFKIGLDCYSKSAPSRAHRETTNIRGSIWNRKKLEIIKLCDISCTAPTFAETPLTVLSHPSQHLPPVIPVWGPFSLQQQQIFLDTFLFLLGDEECRQKNTKTRNVEIGQFLISTLSQAFCFVLLDYIYIIIWLYIFNSKSTKP